MTVNPATLHSINTGSFAVYVACILTAVMMCFPPFTSLNGTEYAFILTGPEWSGMMKMMGEELGLTPRLHWVLLLVQIAAVWAIALGTRWYFGGQRAALLLLTPMLLSLSHNITEVLS